MISVIVVKAKRAAHFLQNGLGYAGLFCFVFGLLYGIANGVRSGIRTEAAEVRTMWLGAGWVFLILWLSIHLLRSLHLERGRSNARRQFNFVMTDALTGHIKITGCGTGWVEYRWRSEPSDTTLRLRSLPTVTGLLWANDESETYEPSSFDDNLDGHWREIAVSGVDPWAVCVHFRLASNAKRERPCAIIVRVRGRVTNVILPQSPTITESGGAYGFPVVIPLDPNELG